MIPTENNLEESSLPFLSWARWRSWPCRGAASVWEPVVDSCVIPPITRGGLVGSAAFLAAGKASSTQLLKDKAKT